MVLRYVVLRRSSRCRTHNHTSTEDEAIDFELYLRSLPACFLRSSLVIIALARLARHYASISCPFLSHSHLHVVLHVGHTVHYFKCNFTRNALSMLIMYWRIVTNLAEVYEKPLFQYRYHEIVAVAT